MLLKSGWFLFVCVAATAIVSCAPVAKSAYRTSSSYGAYMKGLLTDRLGSFEEATVYYRQARHLDQKSPSPHIQLGLDYIGLKDLRAAAVELRTALLLAPDDAQTRYVLALIYAQLNDYKKAAEQYEILLKDAAAALSQKT
jgi:Flp pilus assembly protein TadD